MSSLIVNSLFYSIRVRFGSVQNGNAADLIGHLDIQLLFYLLTQLGAFIFIYASDADFNQIMGIERIVYLSEDCIRKAVLPNHHGWF